MMCEYVHFNGLYLTNLHVLFVMHDVSTFERRKMDGTYIVPRSILNCEDDGRFGLAGNCRAVELGKDSIG